MKKPLVVILNGPPGCGKDTISREWLCLREQGVSKFGHAFKEPMFRIAAETLGMGFHEFLSEYENRDWKERQRPEWGNQSVRDLMIRISETYIKPFFGEDYFGKLAKQNIDMCGGFEENTNVHIFSDGGFDSEIKLLEEYYDVQVIHIFREGCDFSGDSRSYIGCRKGPITLENNGTVKDAVISLNLIISDLIKNLS